MKTTMAALAAFFMTIGTALADATTTLNIPVGDLVANSAGYAGVVLAALITWALRFLPAQLQALALTLRVDQLLQRGVDYGINAVKGATADKNMTIDVGNAVLKEALAFALQHGSDAVKQFCGSPLDLAEKIWARLNLASDASKPDFAAIVAEVAVKLPKARS